MYGKKWISNKKRKDIFFPYQRDNQRLNLPLNVILSRTVKVSILFY